MLVYQRVSNPPKISKKQPTQPTQKPAAPRVCPRSRAEATNPGFWTTFSWSELTPQAPFRALCRKTLVAKDILEDILGVVYGGIFYGIKNQLLNMINWFFWVSLKKRISPIYGDVGRDNDRKPVGIRGHPVFKQFHLKHCWGKSQGQSHTAKQNQGLRCSHFFIAGIYTL